MISEFSRDLDDPDLPLKEAIAARPGKPLKMRVQPGLLQPNGTYKGWKSVSWSLEVDDIAEARAIQHAMELFFRAMSDAGPKRVQAVLGALRRGAA